MVPAMVLSIVFLAQAPASSRPAAGRCPPSADSTDAAGMLCAGEEELADADVMPKDTGGREAGWQRAADTLRRAATVARDSAIKKRALEQLERVYDAKHLGQPVQADPVLRELIALTPNELAPLFRLAKLQESQDLIDAAESTLISARQQHADEIEPYRQLAQFYARRATAMGNEATRQERANQPQRQSGALDANGIYSVGGPMAPPARERTVAPETPADAKAAGIDGVVICEIVVDESGRVKDARILRSIPMLDQAALATVRQWRYAPTIVDGRAVPVRLTVTVTFGR